MKLAVLTASVNPLRTMQFWDSWRRRAAKSYDILWGMVVNGQELIELQPAEDLFPKGILVITPNILGVVPAFAVGVKLAVAAGADIIACFHDDLRIDEDGWDQKILDLFAAEPGCVLAGFGGATGLGAHDIYKVPYNPMLLARQGFMSNMVHAEVHGMRSLERQRVACLDGFSLIGRRDFFEEAWPEMERLGVVHHCYDSYLGALAAEQGGEVWYLPVACHHHGGMTAVANSDYLAWAKTQRGPGGDGTFWEEAHQITYTRFRESGVLPIRIK